MATTAEYIEFAVDQIRHTGNVRYRKMFGEYMIYVDDKPILLVCDNTVYVRKQPEKLPEIEELMRDAECGVPYGSAKEHYILDIENTELSDKVIAALLKVIPVPKPKKSKLQ